MSEVRYQQVAETGPHGWLRVSPSQRIVEWRHQAGGTLCVLATQE